MGYFRPHRDSPSAFNDAFDDAFLRLIGDFNGVRIAGEAASASTPRGMRLVYNTMEIVIDTTGLANFKSGLFRLDSVSTPELRAILVSNVNIQINKDLIESPFNVGITYIQAGIELPERSNFVRCQVVGDSDTIPNSKLITMVW